MFLKENACVRNPVVDEEGQLWVGKRTLSLSTQITHHTLGLHANVAFLFIKCF